MILLLKFFLDSPANTPTGVLDQSQQINTCAVSTEIATSSPSTISQTFTAGISGSLTRVDVYFTILTEESNFHLLVTDGTNTATSDMVDIHSQGTYWRPVAFSTPLTVTAGTVYTLTPVADGVSAIIEWCGTAADSYSRGAAGAGATGVGDFSFKTYVN